MGSADQSGRTPERLALGRWPVGSVFRALAGAALTVFLVGSGLPGRAAACAGADTWNPPRHFVRRGRA
jgi:hypothetical protein